MKEELEYMVIWPDFIENPTEVYRPGVEDDERRRAALADQLCAWGCCMMGATIPEKFGEAMTILGDITGVDTSDQCLALVKEINRKDEAGS